jgi:hypothetical protein
LISGFVCLIDADGDKKEKAVVRTKLKVSACYVWRVNCNHETKMDGQTAALLVDCHIASFIRNNKSEWAILGWQC